jgi:formylglycine-generating enzyme required for sulfatase activity
VYADNSGGQTADVGSKPGGVSWVGALDMSGNVWQWVSSIYRAYPYVPNDGRESSEVAMDQLRVQRGGSWSNPDTDSLRSAFRNKLVASGMGADNAGFGFRCARSFDTAALAVTAVLAPQVSLPVVTANAQ